MSFLVYINRLLYSSLHEHSQVFENALYLKICDYIHQNLEDDLSLERIAANFYVSKYHIAHIFKDNMGISLHQYILKSGFMPAARRSSPANLSAVFSTIWF